MDEKRQVTTLAPLRGPWHHLVMHSIALKIAAPLALSLAACTAPVAPGASEATTARAEAKAATAPLGGES